MRKYAWIAGVAAVVVATVLVVRAVRRQSGAAARAPGAAEMGPHGFGSPQVPVPGGMGDAMPPGHGMGDAMPPGHGMGDAMPPGHGMGDAMPPGQASTPSAANAVVDYAFTMARLEAYAAAVKEIRAAGEKDAALMAKLRGPMPPGARVDELAAWLEGIGPVKEILRRHGLKGVDLVLMPQALVQGRDAYAALRSGVPISEAQVNAWSLALHQTDPRRMSSIFRDILQDLAAISGD